MCTERFVGSSGVRNGYDIGANLPRVELVETYRFRINSNAVYMCDTNLLTFAISGTLVDLMYRSLCDHRRRTYLPNCTIFAKRCRCFDTLQSSLRGSYARIAITTLFIISRLAANSTSVLARLMCCSSEGFGHRKHRHFPCSIIDSDTKLHHMTFETQFHHNSAQVDGHVMTLTSPTFLLDETDSVETWSICFD